MHSLLNIITFSFVLCLTHFSFAQQKPFQLIDGKNTFQFDDEKELKKHLDSMTNLGFYTLKIDSVVQKENTKYWHIHKGKSYREIHVTLDSLASIALQKVSIATQNIDSVMQVVHLFYLQKGYAFNTISFEKNDTQYFLKTSLGKTIEIQGIVVESDRKITRNFTKELKRRYVGSVFSPAILPLISRELQLYNSLTETKKPQVLFTTDSTKIYTYVKKKKSSFVDGILGFSTDKEGDFTASGNVNLQLNNVFSSFEKINLQWNASAEKAQDLQIVVETPYFVHFRLGSEFAIHIFRQDSTFASFTLKNKLYYKLAFNHRLGLNSFISSSNYLVDDEFGNDFTKKGIGLYYEKYELLPLSHLGFRYLCQFYINTAEKRISGNEKLQQFLISGKAEKTLKLKNTHYVTGKINYYNLLSDSYITNELERIGGVYSLRGFNEQAIYANHYIINTLEYKYVPYDYFYANVFIDYAYVSNKATSTTQNLLGTGIGIGFLSKFGFFTLQYAFGKFPNVSFDFNQSKIHVGVKAVF